MITVPLIKQFVCDKIISLPEIREYKNDINVFLTGSRAAGGFMAKSDVDIDILCRRQVFENIQRNFYENGKTSSISAAFYSIDKTDYAPYFGDISYPHFSIAPEEKIIGRLAKYDPEQMWIWKTAVLLVDNSISEKIRPEMFVFPKDVLIKKMKKHYLAFLYSLIDAYPSHPETDKMKHMAVYAIYDGLVNLYRFCFLAEGKPFPYTEKLMKHVASTMLYQKTENIFLEIYALLEDLSGWDSIEKARQMLICDDICESSVIIGKLIDEALLENGCDPAWVAGGYDNIDEFCYGDLE